VWYRSSLDEGDSSLIEYRTRPFSKGDNKSAKCIVGSFNIFFSRTMGSEKLKYRVNFIKFMVPEGREGAQ
jgi:hypothetical protein